jgi:hypothetical protein
VVIQQEIGGAWDDRDDDRPDAIGPMLRAFELLAALAQELHTEGPGADPRICELGNVTIDGVLRWIGRAQHDLEFDDVFRNDTSDLDQAFVSIRTANLRGWLYGRLHNEQQALESEDETDAVTAHLGRLKELQTQLTAVANELQQAHECGVSVIPAAVSLYRRLHDRVMELLQDDPVLVAEIQVAAPELHDDSSVAGVRVVVSQFSRWLLGVIGWLERKEKDAPCNGVPPGPGNYL